MSKNTEDDQNLNKKLFDSYEGQSDDGGYTPDLFYEEYDHIDEDELAVFESENHASLIGTILTPYKGSMLVGGNIIEESGNPGVTGELLNNNQYLQIFIYLCDIEKIYTY